MTLRATLSFGLSDTTEGTTSTTTDTISVHPANSHLQEATTPNFQPPPGGTAAHTLK